MKQYIVKQINTATENNPNFAGKTETWFMGKGGYGKREIKWLPKGGWSRKCFAEQYIEKCKNYSEELKKHGGEYWTHEYEILEIER